MEERGSLFAEYVERSDFSTFFGVLAARKNNFVPFLPCFSPASALLPPAESIFSRIAAGRERRRTFVLPFDQLFARAEVKNYHLESICMEIERSRPH